MVTRIPWMGQQGPSIIFFNVHPWENTMIYGNENKERIATIGGTFDTLHSGHKEYIRLAFEYADRVLIYLNSDEYTNGKKHYSVRPYEFRFEQLKTFIRDIGCESRCEIRRLYNFPEDVKNDYLTDANLKEKINIAIVSPEYYDYFLEINREREARYMNSILILVKPRKLDHNNKDISSSMIRNYDIEKHLLCIESSS
jgi:cytidyltransferase-like protein